MNDDKTIGMMLEEEYRSTLEAVSMATHQTEEANWQLRKLAQIHEQLVNERKLENDDHYRWLEAQAKQRQIEDGKTDRIIGYILTGAGILVPVAASCYWMAKGLKFEEEGTFTSRTGQWLSSHLRLFRK